MAQGDVRIGVDVGGTNTDLLMSEEISETASRISHYKLPSTVDDQSRGVIAGITEICKRAHVPLGRVTHVIHGTTVATNAVLEHKGANVGMVTTKGFRDILHIGRHKRPYNFSLHFDVPWQSHPLVQRRNRISIDERVGPDGSEVTPLDASGVRAAGELFKARGVEAVVVCFMFSFLNDAHERRAQEILRDILGPDFPIWRSSEVANVMREYERFSTTAMNGYVGASTGRYLKRLESKLKDAGVSASLSVMQSNGGLGSAADGAFLPVNLLMSGPVGGVIGGRFFASADGENQLITVDIGGTSADIAVIAAGDLRIRNARDAEFGGYAVMAPMVDVLTIGAGGGSIAFVDSAGGFNVGPQSAGARPGPACYGLGGMDPTVTDANVVLGRLDPDRMLGGDLSADADLAEKAIYNRVAKPLGISIPEAALGILRVVNNNMALAIRSMSVSRGIDPRDFVLLPSGGAGPLHGAAIATIVGTRGVYVPPLPGITAAGGLLASRLQFEAARSTPYNVDKIGADDIARLNDVIVELDEKCRAELIADGAASTDISIEHVAECRYFGQGFELQVGVESIPLGKDEIARVVARFHETHERDYGYHFEGAPVELVTLRTIAKGPQQALRWKRTEPDRARGSDSLKAALMYERETVFQDGKPVKTPRYDRDKLVAGAVVVGPAIVIQRDSTTLVPPSWQAEVLAYGGMLMSRAARGAG